MPLSIKEKRPISYAMMHARLMWISETGRQSACAQTGREAECMRTNRQAKCMLTDRQAECMHTDKPAGGCGTGSKWAGRQA